MPEHVPCPHCGLCAADADGFACDYCRGYAHRPSGQTLRPRCRHCGETFVSLLGAGSDAGRFCSACAQYEGFPDANVPQGEAVRLFTPAPAQMPGQTSLSVPCPDDCTCFLCLAARGRPRRAGQFACASCGTDEAMPGHKC
jgi:hypothetical protein